MLKSGLICHCEIKSITVCTRKKCKVGTPLCNDIKCPYMILGAQKMKQSFNISFAHFRCSKDESCKCIVPIDMNRGHMLLRLDTFMQSSTFNYTIIHCTFVKAFILQAQVFFCNYVPLGIYPMQYYFYFTREVNVKCLSKIIHICLCEATKVPRLKL